jgi:glycosyltransferase involved in cell wall biosynthesis
MAKVDMHVHSIHSEHPSEWFLQRIGAAESYTDPHFVYKTAKERGMNFVTITDHNRIFGSLLLKQHYPNDVFTGVEVTVYFPEDSCKIHVLVYGLTERQFNEIQKVRNDVYQFRDYIAQERLAYSIAHATYSVNKKLTITHLEKLVLMFDIFEGINGGRCYQNNDIWVRCINSLNAGKVGDLYNKYRIEPLSDDPWIKGFTGGSDDHAGFFIGKTYTTCEAQNPEQFLQELRNKKTKSEGRHNDYKSLAFAVYKIAYDFSQKKSSDIKHPLLQQLTNSLFEKKTSNKFSKFNLYAIINKKKISEDPLKEKIAYLLRIMETDNKTERDEQFNAIFSGLSEVADELFLTFVKKVTDIIQDGDFFSLLKNISGILPGIFLSLPFFTTLKHMNYGKTLFAEIEESFKLTRDSEKKILWFTDTFKDLNGVAVTLQKIAQVSLEMQKNIKIVTSLQKNDDINVINLPSIYSFNLPHYESYKMCVPSLLSTVDQLSSMSPDEIYISTPGPIGLLGLLLSKLLNIPAIGVYHTDFTKQYESIDEDGSATDTLDAYLKWFYEAMDKILVPTEVYKNILIERGFNSSKIGTILKGIESNVFNFNHKSNVLKNKYRINSEIKLLYSGRVSKDKNIDFVVKLIIERFSSEISLIIVGDGPHLETLKYNYKKYPNIHFIGKVSREELAEMYCECDLFLFPSKTDTFGMVVLEALACGLPCIVSDVGGPQELVEENFSGFVCDTDSFAKWELCIKEVLNKKINTPEQYENWRKSISEKILAKYNWEKAIQKIVGNQ